MPPLRGIAWRGVGLGVLLGLAGCGHANNLLRATPTPLILVPTPTPVVSTTCPAGAQVVDTAAELTAALGNARPGRAISLAAGTYVGNFVANSSGEKGAPITLCGPRSAVIDGGSLTSGYGFYLLGASWWVVSGFTIQDAQKGLVTDHGNNNVIEDLGIRNIGDEGIHLRAFSSHNLLENNQIRNTGLDVAFYGEGIYVGSAHSNWCHYSNCGPDKSDNNVIRGNNIADTTAENIDIKEGTSGGIIEGNQLSGVGMVLSAAKGWINVKGNDWMITNNSGSTTPEYGFEVHQVYEGWGYGNQFSGNTAVIDGSGPGFYVQDPSLNTTVSCNNTAVGSAMGLSNLACT